MKKILLVLLILVTTLSACGRSEDEQVQGQTEEQAEVLVLAVSSGSRHKEAAWEFIRRCLDGPAQRELPSGFPVCRSVLEERLEDAMETEYGTDENGMGHPVVKHQVLFEGEEPVDIYSITQEQADRLLALLEGARYCSQTDNKIYQIFLDEAGSYFSGDKSLEETADVIQARVSMYVAEKIK